MATTKNRRSSPLGNIRLAILAICLCLAIAAFASRLYRLSEIPPGLFLDEGAHGVDALQVLEGTHTPFFPDNSGREGLIVYAVALAHAILGTSILSIRLPTALASAGAVLTLFYAGYTLFSVDERTKSFRPWRGIFIGGISAALLAVSLNHLVLGRLAVRANFLILLLPLSFALLWKGWRERRWLTIALSGLCAGILQYTYTPARLHPFLLLLFGISLLLPPDGKIVPKTRDALFRSVPFLAAFALLVAPLCAYFVAHPDQMTERIGHLSIFALENPWTRLLTNAWDHLLVFGFRGDPNWAHTYDSIPMLNPWEAFLFWAGLGFALWRWRTDITARLLVMWLGVMLIPAFLSYDVPRHTLRMIGAAPAVYLLLGFGLWEFLQVMKRGIPRLALPAIFLLSALILLQGLFSYSTYFQKYASFALEQEDFHGQWSEAALELSALPPVEGQIYLILSANRYSHYGFDYLYEGTSPVYIVNHRGPGMPYKTGTPRDTFFMLAGNDQMSSIVLLDWDDQLRWNDEEEREMFNFLRRHGRYTGSAKHPNFQAHTFTDLQLQLPWRFYEQMESRAFYYDADITLLGSVVGQGDDPSPWEVLFGNRAEPIWVGMRWQLEHGNFNPAVPSSHEVNYKISLRLYDAAGKIAYQKDRSLKNAHFEGTSAWAPGQPVDTLFFLDLPSGFPPGHYDLCILLYDAETNQPTVQIGTWAPELPLKNILVPRVHASSQAREGARAVPPPPSRGEACGGGEGGS